MCCLANGRLPVGLSGPEGVDPTAREGIRLTSAAPYTGRRLSGSGTMSLAAGSPAFVSVTVAVCSIASHSTA